MSYNDFGVNGFGDNGFGDNDFGDNDLDRKGGCCPSDLPTCYSGSHLRSGVVAAQKLSVLPGGIALQVASLILLPAVCTVALPFNLCKESPCSSSVSTGKKISDGINQVGMLFSCLVCCIPCSLACMSVTHPVCPAKVNDCVKFKSYSTCFDFLFCQRRGGSCEGLASHEVATRLADICAVEQCFQSYGYT